MICTLKSALSAGEGDDSFAEYAESVGARDLPELLEAAAAYMSFVERHEQFSRPQLMTKVRQVETEESSREDRLRSFGQLLREGGPRAIRRATALEMMYRLMQFSELGHNIVHGSYDHLPGNDKYIRYICDIYRWHLKKNATQVIPKHVAHLNVAHPF